MSESTMIPRAIDALRAGRIREAESMCRRRLGAAPTDAAALYVLCCCLMARGAFGESAELAERALARHPEDPRFAVELGTARMGEGRFDDAVDAFDQALAINPDHAAALAGKADSLVRCGHLDIAAAILAPHAKDPAPAVAVVLAALLERQGRRKEAIACAKRALDAGDLDPYVRRNLLTTVARAHERLGKADDAFAAYKLSHEGLRQPFDGTGYIAWIDALIAAFSAERLRTLPRASTRSRRPMVIAGMPRSGTSLVEQIIDAHPDACGGGELPLMGQIMRSLSATVGVKTPFPDCLAALTAAHADAAGRQYLDGLKDVASDARRVTDKAMSNVQLLGLFQILVPTARVIRCRRDPVDTCFSCYTSNLPPTIHPYVTDLDRLALVHRQHDRLWQHWTTVLDLAVLDVSYEALTADPESVMREIISFCDLDWDDACLTFHESERAVLTASFDQVRRPLYRSSVGRAAPFAAHLGPLTAGLADGARHSDGT